MLSILRSTKSRASQITRCISTTVGSRQQQQSVEGTDADYSKYEIEIA